MSSEAEDVTTVLVITGMGVPPYSARGLSQTLQPIDAAASMRRTVNGDLVDLSASQFKKYASTITCADQDVPAFEGYWPGDEVIVDCVAELAYRTNSEGPTREVVEGSEREQGDFTFYRPRLHMMIKSFNEQTDEYGAQTSWSLDLEEI